MIKTSNKFSNSTVKSSMEQILTQEIVYFCVFFFVYLFQWQSLVLILWNILAKTFGTNRNDQFHGITGVNSYSKKTKIINKKTNKISVLSFLLIIITMDTHFNFTITRSNDWRPRGAFVESNPRYRIHSTFSVPIFWDGVSNMDTRHTKDFMHVHEISTDMSERTKRFYSIKLQSFLCDLWDT